MDFNNTSRKVFNHIRGLNPWPSAYAVLDDQEMKIYDSEILDKDFSAKTCGEIVDVNKEGIVVKTVDGSIVLKTIFSLFYKFYIFIILSKNIFIYINSFYFTLFFIPLEFKSLSMSFLAELFLLYLHILLTTLCL